MRKHDTSYRPVSVCTSVTLEYCIQYCIQTAKDIAKLLSRAGSAIVLVFFSPSAVIIQFRGQPIQQRLKYTGGGGKIAIFD